MFAIEHWENLLTPDTMKTIKFPRKLGEQILVKVEIFDKIINLV